MSFDLGVVVAEEWELTHPQPGTLISPELGVWRVSPGPNVALTNLNVGARLHEGEIRGTKFEDANGNGAFDAGEAPLAGWEMFIDFNHNGQRDPDEPMTTTDASGEYRFTDLVPGRHYRVVEVPQEHWFQTAPAVVNDEPFAMGTSPQSVAVADLDLDGDVDLVAADEASIHLVVRPHCPGLFQSSKRDLRR
jgi:hypothetical protein